MPEHKRCTKYFSSQTLPATIASILLLLTHKVTNPKNDNAGFLMFYFSCFCVYPHLQILSNIITIIHMKQASQHHMTFQKLSLLKQYFFELFPQNGEQNTLQTIGQNLSFQTTEKQSKHSRFLDHTSDCMGVRNRFCT